MMPAQLSKVLRPAFGVGFRSTCESHLLKVPLRCPSSQRFVSSSERNLSRPIITWRNVVIVGIFGAAAAYFVRDMRMEKQKRQMIQRKKLLGKASIGGPFELVDSEGKSKSSEDFKGQWLLIYFGFTHCPDICPDEIEKMVKCVELIEKSEYVPNVQPLFISVDPERDTPEIVGKYTKEYSSKIIGLTGNPEQVDKVCKAYRVYYSAGPPDEDKDYIVDHTIITYLINPDGDFVDYYGQTRNAEEMSSAIQMQMLSFEKMKKIEDKPSLSSLFKSDDVVVQKVKI